MLLVPWRLTYRLCMSIAYTKWSCCRDLLKRVGCEACAFQVSRAVLEGLTHHPGHTFPTPAGEGDVRGACGEPWGADEEAAQRRGGGAGGGVWQQGLLPTGDLRRAGEGEQGIIIHFGWDASYFIGLIGGDVRQQGLLPAGDLRRAGEGEGLRKGVTWMPPATRFRSLDGYEETSGSKLCCRRKMRSGSVQGKNSYAEMWVICLDSCSHPFHTPPTPQNPQVLLGLPGWAGMTPEQGLAPVHRLP